MALTYQIEEGIVRFVFSGGTPARDVYSVFHRAYGDPKCPPDALVFVDLTQSTSLATRTPEMVKMLCEFVLEHPDRPGDRVAIAAPAEAIDRFDRVVLDASRAQSLRARLFTDVSEALAWLRADEAKG